MPGDYFLPLRSGIADGDLVQVKHLVAEGADLNARGHYCGDTPFLFACREGQLEIVKYLSGLPQVDVTQVTNYSCTGLYLACIRGCLALVEFLLDDGRIDPNRATINNTTPLHIACNQGASHLGIVKLLSQHPRVNVSTQNDMDSTPILEASGKCPEMVTWILASGKDVDVEPAHPVGRTPSEEAAYWGYVGLVRLLVDYRDDRRRTVLELRARLGLNTEDAARIFALVVYLCDGHFSVEWSVSVADNTAARRFFRLAQRLPMELQMMLCNRVYGVDKDRIPVRETERALREIATYKKFGF